MAAILKAWVLIWVLAGFGTALADVPARVGRIAHVENGVDFRPAFGEPHSPAMQNWPVTTGNIVETGSHGQAEIRAASTAVRIAPDSVVEVGQLDERRFMVYLTRGSIHLRVAPMSPDEFAVRTPTGRIRVMTEALLRIDIDTFDDSAVITVHEGTVIVENERSSVRLAAGKKALLQRNDLHASGIAAAQSDAFDRWSSERDRSFRQAAARHVSPEMTGYEELARHGVWHQHAELGVVWYPTSVGDDWAPYRYGHWAHINPWGWTWIDQAPWGYAPTHYGRWAYIDRRWGWLPGVVTVRPVWAPALVAWVGGRDWQASFSFGNAPAVGWVPLGPHERYVPGYRVSEDYLRRLNPHQTITVQPSVGLSSSERLREDRRFADNRHAPNAVNLLPQDRFSVPVAGGAAGITVQRVVPTAPDAVIGQPVPSRSAAAPLAGAPSFTTNSPPPTLSSPRFTPPASQAPPGTARHGVIIGGSSGLQSVPGNPATAYKTPQFSPGATIGTPVPGATTPRVIDAQPSMQFNSRRPQPGAGAAMPQFARPQPGAPGGTGMHSMPAPRGLQQGR